MLYDKSNIDAAKFLASKVAMRLANSQDKRRETAEENFGPLAVVVSETKNGAQPIALGKLSGTIRTAETARKAAEEFQHVVSTGNLDRDVKVTAADRKLMYDVYSQIRDAKGSDARKAGLAKLRGLAARIVKLDVVEAAKVG